MESKSVWVCINRPQVAQKDTKNCDHIRADGSCSCYGMTNRKPCDAVEYAPVKRGVWGYSLDAGADPYARFCSECGEWQHREEPTKYCPNCGCKMEV